jgi:hypothetical protein
MDGDGAESRWGWFNFKLGTSREGHAAVGRVRLVCGDGRQGGIFFSCPNSDLAL